MVSLTGKKILVVDDEPLIRELISEALSLRGCATIAASNGNDGYRCFEEQRPNVIISDVRMSGGDGTELLRRVRAVAPDFPVFCLISGFADVTNDSLYDMGTDAIFPKPFSMRKVIAVLNGLLVPPEQRWISGGSGTGLLLRRTEISPLHIGRGGIFIPGLFDVIVEDLVQFELHYSDGESVQMLEGSGIVRWNRNRSDGLGVGIGVEILTLIEPGRSEILRRIKELRPKAFIPQGGTGG